MVVAFTFIVILNLQLLHCSKLIQRKYFLHTMLDNK